MTQEPPFDRGPYLLAALLCEKVLVEQDGVKSAIRIVDRVTLTAAGPAPPTDMPTLPYQFTLLLNLKSGSARGSKTLEIRLQKPSGESPAPLMQSINFEGDDDRGIDVVMNMQLGLDQTGLYWFDVQLDGIRLTRIPLRVLYQQITQTGAGGAGPPQGGGQG